jgi:hypothetical protein
LVAALQPREYHLFQIAVLPKLNVLLEEWSGTIPFIPKVCKQSTIDLENRQPYFLDLD